MRMVRPMPPERHHVAFVLFFGNRFDHEAESAAVHLLVDSATSSPLHLTNFRYEEV